MANDTAALEAQLLAAGAAGLSFASEGNNKFQSTLSVRRATVQLDIFVHFLRRKPAAWL